ncbi:MAG TPA: FHA domain-containing protein [Nevskiaceae bacterium]|nr:FHA domain-containing protein [Nevskiaceae bacterium]
MRVVVRTLSMNGNQVVWTERTLDTERLRIGRGTEQDVELGDIRVALAHAEIVAGRPYKLTARPGATVWVNDAPLHDADLNIGDVIDIGRYRLTVLSPELGTDLLISVQEWISAREEKQQRLRALQTRLEHTGFSRRRWAWWLALAVLLPGLLLPVWLRYHVNAADPGDQVWLPGPLSRAHAQFGDNCSACHGAPFERVRNSACAACHAGVHQHTDNPALLGQVQFAKARCAACHYEHHGDHGLLLPHPAICTDCHGQPEAGLTDTRVPMVADFMRSHPPLRASVARYSGGTFAIMRVEPGSADWQQQLNLRFPHDRHLLASGIDSPQGRKQLHCADCHQPDSSGKNFAPVSMQAHCSGCHKLDFDPAAPTRELPHAKPQEVVQVIRDYYAQRALHGGDPQRHDDGELRRVPGPGETPSPADLAWAERRARQAIDDVFDRRVCVYCHLVERTGDAQLPWRIAPVAPWLAGYPHAKFDHAAHRMQKCESCHAARASSNSSDVLLPDIASCRGCHGDPGQPERVPSTCTSCHGFHIARTQLMTPARKGVR